jgi:hypothetical protein
VAIKIQRRAPMYRVFFSRSSRLKERMTFKKSLRKIGL